jgi:nicotinate-nucleotide pyrophosphorylase (carboxylating)
LPIDLLPIEISKDAGALIRLALAEDIGAGDVTSASVIPAGLRFNGVMRARHALVLAGLPVAREVFRIVVPEAVFEARIEDGQSVEAGAALAEIRGPARGLLTAERTALNFVQFTTGIATLTRAYAEKIHGTNCILLDTRKTVPGLRRLSKYATRCGGAQNHRMGLFDGVLIKDNHVALAGGVGEAVRHARTANLKIEVECDTLDQVREATEAGADIILLDNMTPDQLRAAVQIVGGRAKTEASGGVNLETIRGIAETGVDFVSVGRITQSAPAADIGLDWSPAQ